MCLSQLLTFLLSSFSLSLCSFCLWVSSRSWFCLWSSFSCWTLFRESRSTCISPLFKTIFSSISFSYIHAYTLVCISFCDLFDVFRPATSTLDEYTGTVSLYISAKTAVECNCIYTNLGCTHILSVIVYVMFWSYVVSMNVGHHHISLNHTWFIFLFCLSPYILLSHLQYCICRIIFALLSSIWSKCILHVQVLFFQLYKGKNRKSHLPLLFCMPSLQQTVGVFFVWPKPLLHWDSWTHSGALSTSTTLTYRINSHSHLKAS